MTKNNSDKKVIKKWKNYFTGIITTNFMTFNKIDKYFRAPISDSTVKAIQENWIRILGIDYEIISMNLCKDNQPLGIALEGRNEISRDAQEVIQRHFLRAIMPKLCIGLTHKFMIRDELLEVNGLKIMGMPTKEVVHTLKKLTNYFQIVVARSMHHNYELASDYGGSEDNINSPISFFDMDDDESSRNGTLRSVTSNYSNTSRDFGSNVSFAGMIDGQSENVRVYLRNIVGWRGPLVLEFRKQKESLGLALEEIVDPRSEQMIIVFKVIVPNMKAGKDGRLHAGDRLLQVNGKSVNGIPFRKVCQWMKSAPGGRLVICICKPHFEPQSYDPQHSNLQTDENLFCNTLTDTDKLPKLSEETDVESFEIPPAPTHLENQIVLKRSDNKLGIFLDITDNGCHGCRIKKISRGIAKDDGTLQEGDYLTTINELSLRVDDKAKLDNCLKMIAADTHDYKISYITAEDIDKHKRKYSSKSISQTDIIRKDSPIVNIYPDTSDIISEQTTQQCLPEKVKEPKLSFQIYDVTIENDHRTNLGLVLSPSLKEPTKFISITDINEESLADKCGLLKINDDILMVNNYNFENISVYNAAQFLRNALITESFLIFKVRRLMSSDDENESKTLLDSGMNIKLMALPDIYCCSIDKRSNGYGFSIMDINATHGVIVKNIDPLSAASKINQLKCGDRFVMINKCPVINSSKPKIMEIVRNSTRNLHLIMETPKYREFSVQIVKDSSTSLGLNVGGGIDTKSPIPIIESLVADRTSKFSENLCAGDYILEVDGNNMSKQNHEQVIHILRSTGKECHFKILRHLPYNKRDILSNIEASEFANNYTMECQYSVQINKPIDTIKTFGINFTDIVVMDMNGEFQIISRYKAVISIDNNSLADKYATQIRPHDYIISVNNELIDCDMSIDELKNWIDNCDRVTLLFSRDIPYRFQTANHNEDHDSPILLKNSYSNLSDSDSSSEEDLVYVPPTKEEIIEIVNKLTDKNVIEECKNIEEICDNDVNYKNKVVISTDLSNEISDNTTAISESTEIVKDNVVDEVEQCNNVERSDTGILIKDSETTEEILKDENNCDNEKENDTKSEDNEVVSNSEDNEQPISELVINIDDKQSAENVKENWDDQEEQFDKIKSNDLKENGTAEDILKDDNNCDSPKKNDSETEDIDNMENVSNSENNNPISELGINIDYVTIPRLPNTELGFQIYGGLNGGPSGETLPIFVIGVEKNSCNWPNDHEEPLLSNGQHLLELNDVKLSSMKLSHIESMIKQTEGELKFKIVTFK